MKRRNRRRNRSNTEIQSLECRQLKTGLTMGSTPVKATMPNAATLNAGILTVDGTNAADQITVSESFGSSGSALVRYLNVRVQSSTNKLASVSRFRKSLVSEIHISGRRGNDTISNNTDVPSVLRGQGGNDTILGGTRADEIHGNGGNDRILGRNGDDDLLGGSGNDTLIGGAHNDSLNGGSGEDHIDGDSGRDTLLGGSGNDRMFGGANNDRLDGQGGADGVFGGTGSDTLTGGGGNDRFLMWYDQQGFLQATHNDTMNDRGGRDAEVRFIDTDHGTIESSYTSNRWTENEIEVLDTGLQMLMDRTGNTDLLKKHNNNVMEIKRFGTSSDGSEAWGSNNDSRIAILNGAFADDDTFANYVLLHEVAHFWDDRGENSSVPDFRDISGWRRTRNPGSTETASGDEKWAHSSTASFVSVYASFNPREDWAETFATNMMVNAGFPIEGDWADFNDTTEGTVAASASKMSALDDFFRDMS